MKKRPLTRLDYFVAACNFIGTAGALLGLVAAILHWVHVVYG